MKLTLERYSGGLESTLGILRIDGAVRAFTCEDQHQPGPKVPAETRIPAGTYVIKLKTWGGFHDRYTERFPRIHKGMLHLQEVPGFTEILIHVGNTDKDTAGCILVGQSAELHERGGGAIWRSTQAYESIYPDVAAAIERGDAVEIEIVDRD